MNHELTPINHMSTNTMACDGNLTFRRRSQWISQVDWAICSRTKQTIDTIQSYRVLQNMNLPTNHWYLIALDFRPPLS